MPKIKAVNHVAVVVDNMEKSLLFWRDALGGSLGFLFPGGGTRAADGSLRACLDRLATGAIGTADLGRRGDLRSPLRCGPLERSLSGGSGQRNLCELALQHRSGWRLEDSGRR